PSTPEKISKAYFMPILGIKFEKMELDVGLSDLKSLKS
ncbi:MAG: hypothetical protein ACI8RA_002775, partial [Chlamydiales bacterium]